MTITITEPYMVDGATEILSDEALAFVEELHRRFVGTRDELLEARRTAQRDAAASGRLDFLPDTQEIRDGDWTVAEHPDSLQDRRVEITGPPAPAKMAINALNSGAKVWLACLEDALSPTWFNLVDAQKNLYEAARGTLRFTSPEGKEYTLRDDVTLPTVVVRPRGWHLPEKHLQIDGSPAVGALVDFGLHFFHNAKLLHDQSAGPYYYLPKIEHHQEAKLWDDVFSFAEERLALPHGSVRATVLIETIPAGFQMDEILYALRDHASGLNAGRWDYLFSLIKYFRASGHEFVLPDRAEVGMTQPFMRAYTELLVKTCHRRGAFAMGGMAAFIPNRREPDVTEKAIGKVRDDKSREAGDGFDGSWVAHPDLVEICREEFDKVLGDRPNQVDRQRDDVQVSPEDLLAVEKAEGDVTEAGVRMNLYVAVYYTAIWLSGNGAVAIHNLMEDAATAEISRSQVWQQIRNSTVTADTGVTVTAELVERLLGEEVERLRGEIGDAGTFAKYFEPAAGVVRELVLDADHYEDFLTTPAYELLD
ncbi:malate synthase A [Nesterenkonia sp. HG001]|uniref:malate synthase A n=1 Tax=Nesterenkonia sp. HG001 TaxID=2983207 RepID=UPI002AC5C1CF|nr:malate synthase A [Nesterenkonia sp. HG001]MDZ5079216.1 malate synthase A [Nesterenkonia sp. HG001]